jgi:arylformamidase
VVNVTSAVRPADPRDYFTYRNPDAYHADWKGFYESALPKRELVRARFEHDVDLKYGADPHQLANVYHPRGGTDRPVILFLHGGRWREGHPAFYDHFADPWVRAGAVFVSCGYRLEPDHSIADAVDDAAAALDWVIANASKYGGDPGRVIVAGHSAGGHLAAMVTMTDWRTAGVRRAGIVAGVVCMSAPVDLRSRLSDAATAEELSPVLRITRVPRRVVVSYGDPEPNKKSEGDGFLTSQGQLLVKALTEAGASPAVVTLGEADHIATAAAFADTGSPLYAAAHAVVFEEEGRSA